MLHFILSKYLYTRTIMIVLAMVAIAASLRRSGEIKQFKWIFWYCLAFVLHTLYEPVRLLMGAEAIDRSINAVLENIFLLVEMTTFCYFLCQGITSVIARKLIITIGVVFVVSIMSWWIHSPDCFYGHALQEFFFLKSLLLFIPCLFYFYEAAIADSNPGQWRISFWIVSGIFFLTGSNLGLFLTSEMIPQFETLLNAMSFVVYGVMFLAFTLASFSRFQPVRRDTPP